MSLLIVDFYKMLHEKRKNEQISQKKFETRLFALEGSPT